MGRSDGFLSLPHIQPLSGLLRAGVSGSRGEGSGRVSGSQVQRPVASVRAELMSICPEAQQQHGDQRSGDEERFRKGTNKALGVNEKDNSHCPFGL